MDATNSAATDLRILDARVVVEVYSPGYGSPELLELEPGTRLFADNSVHAVDADTGANYTVHAGTWPADCLYTVEQWAAECAEVAA